MDSSLFPFTMVVASLLTSSNQDIPLMLFIHDLGIIVLLFISSYQIPGGICKLYAALFLQRSCINNYMLTLHIQHLTCKSMVELSIWNSASSKPKTFLIFLGTLASL
jgi:hypothetical protein